MIVVELSFSVFPPTATTELIGGLLVILFVVSDEGVKLADVLTLTPGVSAALTAEKNGWTTPDKAPLTVFAADAKAVVVAPVVVVAAVFAVPVFLVAIVRAAAVGMPAS